MRILKMYPAVLIQTSVEGGETDDFEEERGEESSGANELSGMFERGIENKPATRPGAPSSPTLSARMSTGGVPTLLQEIMESQSALDSYREEPRRQTPETTGFSREGGWRQIERQSSTRVKTSKTGAGKSPCMSAKISTGGIPSMLEVNSAMCCTMHPLSRRSLPLPAPFSSSQTPCLIVFVSSISFPFAISHCQGVHNANLHGCRIIDFGMFKKQHTNRDLPPESKDMAESTRMLDSQDGSQVEAGNNSLGNNSVGNNSFNRIESQPRTVQRPSKGKKSDGAPKSPTMSARVSTGGVPSLLAVSPLYSMTRICKVLPTLCTFSARQCVGA